MINCWKCFIENCYSQFELNSVQQFRDQKHDIEWKELAVKWCKQYKTIYIIKNIWEGAFVCLWCSFSRSRWWLHICILFVKVHGAIHIRYGTFHNYIIYFHKVTIHYNKYTNHCCVLFMGMHIWLIAQNHEETEAQRSKTPQGEVW